MEKSNRNNIFVMVSGPAASGKSTLVDKMRIELPAHFYKPSRAYIDVAKMKGIPVERAFQDVKALEAEEYFCRVCKEHNITIGDQHLSIQPNKDIAIALGNIDIEFSDEPYVSAIDYDLFDKLNASEVKTFLIYLKASAERLYERAYQRNCETGMYIRNKNLSEVTEEVQAEEYYFNELISKVDINSYIIDTDSMSSKDVLDDALKMTLKFKGESCE